MSKKVVISGYYGFENFGDEAILSVLVNKLKSMDIEITVFSSNPELTSNKLKVKSVNTFDYLKVWKTLQNNDILISGGGSLLQDVTSLKSLWYYLAVIFGALINRKKTVIFAQGIGPINNNFARYATKKILKGCSYVSVRDENSFNLLSNWKIKSDLLCDPIYSLDVPVIEKRKVLGVQLRKFKTLNDEFLKSLATNLLEEFSHKKIEIFSLQKSLDYDLSIRFEKMLKSINPEVCTEVVEDNLIDRISSLDYLVGMRFHALLVALKAGVKCTAISYDIKVEKLANKAKIPILQMNDYSNQKKALTEMKALNDYIIIRHCSSNVFDWTNLEKVILDCC